MRTVVAEYRASGGRIMVIVGALLTLFLLVVLAYRAIFHGDPLFSETLALPAIAIAIVLYGVFTMRKEKEWDEKVERLKSIAVPIIPLEIKTVKDKWRSREGSGMHSHRALVFSAVCTFIDPRGNLRDTKRIMYGLDMLGSSPIPPLAAEIYVNPDDFEDYLVMLYLD